jgi:hypothetical protein
MPVQQWIYVSVPVRDAYNAWTEYKQWPRYMHRANQVDPQIDERQVRLRVTEKMWGFKRPFTAEVIRQRPDEHILWNSTEGSKHTGVINFHELAPRLTLIEMNLDHAPSGIAEKISRGARFTKRAVRADLHRFQAWVEMKSDDELAEMEGWRGQIEDGQIVKSHEDAVEEEQQGHDPADHDEEFDDERDEPDSDANSDEPEDGEFDEPEADADDEELDEPENDEDDEFDEPDAEGDDDEMEDEQNDDELPSDEVDEVDEAEDEEPEPDDAKDAQPAAARAPRRSRDRQGNRRQASSRRQRTAAAR